MTKKIFAMFLAVLMVVSMLPTTVFAANCPGKNSPKHSTSNCDYTVVKVTEPTCGTAGHTSYKCNVCGYTFAETTAPATNEHNLVPGEAKAPTCVEDGHEAGVKCTDCPYTKDGATIPALGKEGTDACEWELVSGYDCDDKNGKLVYQCAFCGDVMEIKRTDKAHKHSIYWGEYVAVSDTQVAFFCYGYFTTGCSHYVIADIKNAHDCEDYKVYVAEAPATCTTDGMKAHYQCRICNNKYDYIDDEFTLLTEKIILDEENPYIIYASHSYIDEDGEPIEATCADTLLYCGVCRKYVNPGIEHDVDWKDTAAADGWDDEGYYEEPASCLKPGYIYDNCRNCGIRDLKILEALGHNEVTVSVPSTCGTYAYTFTYCTRGTECDAPALEELEITSEDGLAVSVTDENGFPYSVKVPALDVTDDLSEGFLLGMVQENLEKTLYFNGKMTGNYLATTTDASEAVTLYVENLENFRDRFFVYFVNEDGEKVYINLSEYESNGYYKAKVSLTTKTPEMYFTWDSELNIMIAHGENDNFFLGTYSNYNTISASADFYLTNGSTQFKAQAYAMVGETGVKLTAFTFDVKGGYNAENHDYIIEDGSVVLPSCNEAGSYDMVCAFCFDRVTVELAAGCENNLYYYLVLTAAGVAGLNPDVAVAGAADLTAAGIKNTAPSAAATCTEGAYQYYKCTVEGCENVFKMVLSAPLGHHMSIPHDDTDALGHTKLTGYIGLDCEFCNYAIKYETLSWKNANKLYDTEEKAAEDHFIWVDSGDVDEDGEPIYVKQSTLTHVQLSKNGSCTVTGIELFSCSECGKNVRVRQWQEIDGVKYPTGEHAGHRDNHVDPTCAAEGSHTTYQCARCDAIIGNEKLGETETLDKLSHTYVEVNSLTEAEREELELEEYEAAPCDKPNYTNVKYICTGCGDKKGDGTTWHRENDLNGACAGETIEVYTCHCGEVHIRAMGTYNHKWAMVPAVAVGDKIDGVKIEVGDSRITYQAPTCYQYGWYTIECEYCHAQVKQLIATVEHVNAAGEKFTDSCLDEVTDRHCVVCCEVFNHAAEGNDHDCYKTAKDENDDPYYICETDYHEHDYCTECVFCHLVCDAECELVCSIEDEEHECHVCTEECEDDCDLNDCVLVCPNVCDAECEEHCDDECEEHCNGCADHCNGWNMFTGGCLTFINDGCIVPSFCHYELAESRGSTCVQDAHDLYICADCADEKMVAASVNKDIVPAGTQIGEHTVWFYGHKPVANPDTLANYIYLDVFYQEVNVVDGEFVLNNSLIRNAEFIEYVAPTFTEEGYAKFYCAYCKAVVEQNLPKLTGIGFQLDVSNANGDTKYTYGSLVEVIVSINGNNVDVNSFSFAVNSGFQYAGYETLNGELFNITVSNPEVGKTSAIISGVAANTAAGKMQNIKINGKTELVKLFFRVNDPEATEGNFQFVIREDEDGNKIDDVRKWVSGKTTKSVLSETILLNKTIKVKLFMDFDGNGTASTSDLSLALMLLTGEHPTGATYDVTVDMNKDGVITLEDLAIGHNLLVGNVKYDEVYMMGISGAELDMYAEAMTYYCVHCGQAGITEATNYCPKCGRNPHN